LGALRYAATASPGFVERWFPEGLSEEAAARAPCLVFNRKDRLQALWLRQALGSDVQPPLHWLPSSQAFVDGALAGLGWGMNPDLLVEDHLRAGRLLALKPSEPLEVPLYWQQSRIVGPLLADLTRAVLATARAMLAPMAPGS
jgi:LysR family transcriptional regulator (chromosome initiation inhibitor)